jgi:hypothetical protein
VNPLYDVLNCAALSVLCAEDGSGREAETAFLEASFAAPEAFPPGPLADALNLVLGAVGAMAEGAAA